MSNAFSDKFLTVVQYFYCFSFTVPNISPIFCIISSQRRGGAVYRVFFRANSFRQLFSSRTIDTFALKTANTGWRNSVFFFFFLYINIEFSREPTTNDRDNVKQSNDRTVYFNIVFDENVLWRRVSFFSRKIAGTRRAHNDVLVVHISTDYIIGDFRRESARIESDGSHRRLFTGFRSVLPSHVHIRWVII